MTESERDMRISNLVDLSAGRSEVVDALESAADTIYSQVAGHIGDSYYLVGSGYDFSQFAERFAKNLSMDPLGVACLWTERCDFEGKEGDSAFLLPHEFVEPVSKEQRPNLLICSSIVADKMEVLTHLIRIGPAVRPKRVVIAAALINTGVKRELKGFLSSYFGRDIEFVSDNETSENIENVRDHVADMLDTRRVKAMPIISEWLFSRRYGPRPKRDAGFRPRGW